MLFMFLFLFVVGESRQEGVAVDKGLEEDLEHQSM